MIITEYVAPPVPSTMYDWLAYVDGYAEDGPHGRGSSELEAVKDLALQLNDQVRMSAPGRTDYYCGDEYGDEPYGPETTKGADGA